MFPYPCRIGILYKLKSIFAQELTIAEHMNWITRERPKIDRIACPWLIRRFIDPDAAFYYVPFDQVFSQTWNIRLGGPVALHATFVSPRILVQDYWWKNLIYG